MTSPLLLHSFHAAHGAVFGDVNGREVVLSYGAFESEYDALINQAAVSDFSFRGRLCLLGTDREKFLHGQVTNDVAGLRTGEGCYAALVNLKAKLESDLYIYKLTDELLLDFEPGLSEAVAARLEKYVIAEDVQIVDVSEMYGLLTVQGPQSREVLGKAGFADLPEKLLAWRSISRSGGDLYVMRNPRLGSDGYDLFVPAADLETVCAELKGSIAPAGWEAFETARIEAGIPRFGADMDGSNLPPEAEIQDRAVSYSKGCYIGQEIIARIRTYGQVAKTLRLLRLPEGPLPQPKTKLFSAAGKEAGYITSAVRSPKRGGVVALGYVRKEANSPGSQLRLGAPDGGLVEVLASGLTGPAN